MARKYIGSTLSGGVMALCIILLITPAAHSQFTGMIQKFHISGNVGEPGVTMEGFPVSPAPVTDENGVYSVEVRYGWSGTVTPTKLGYTFEPKQRTYSSVSQDKVGEDYVATLQTFIISGATGEPNVVLQGLPDNPMSDANGRYSVTVTYGWSGTVTPYKEGYQFEPPTKTYDQLIANKTSESYVARKQTFAISGSTGVEGVTMEGLPGNPKTSADGTYKAEVEWGWSGKVTPKKEGHEFMPPYREYASVMMPYTNDDYTAQVFYFEISGTTGMSGVILEGLPGDPITDMDGMYTASVPYGWSGKVTPTKIGYSFSPPFRDYAKIVVNQEDQSYTASVMKYKISGNAGLPGAKMVGLPGDILSGPTGAYEIMVEYGWTGNVSPEKEGYTFDPPTLFLGPVDKDLTRQDFKASAIRYTIAGNVGVEGVLLQGLPGRVLSGADGSYSVEVPYKFRGTVMPIKEGYTFEPPKREYESLMESRPTEDYSGAKRQYTITGTITTDKGPLADVLIMTDPPGPSATTDSDGQFQLSVEHGWKGQLTPVREGCTFTPPNRPAGPIVQNLPNLSFLGKMKMVSITDKIALQLEEGKPPEPIQGVLITAKPGEYTARTDATGRYTIQVPWNWSGALYPTKEGILFNPDSIVYTDVVDDIDNTAPRKPSTQDTGLSQPSGPVVPDATGPVAPPDTTKPPVDVNEGTKPVTAVTPAETEKERLERELEELKKRISQIETMPGPNALETLPAETTIPRPGPVPRQEQIVAGPLVSGQFSGDLFNVLIQISQKSGANIYTDLTVRPVAISPVNLTSVPVTSALEAVLKGTEYTYQKVLNKENTYQVFRPITIMFPADDLRQALQDLSTLAGVPIVSDETVVGQVYADLQNVPLESALEMMLAGTGYEMARMDTYYIVGDRKVDSSVFPRISETRHVRLNYIQPSVARGHLSPAFSQYVQASLDPNSHLVTVTAPTSMMDRIVGELKDMDVRPRHVLLDARIVTMERGDLLNIGVEWGMPTASLGIFGDGWPRQGDLPGSDLPTSSWPWALQIGLSFDRTFTNQLTAALNLLKENNQADIISSPQVLGQDGKRSRIGITQEEYYMMTPPIGQTGLYYSQTQLETITSGTTLAITPRIGDNNDITLEMAVEVSDSIPRGRGSDLPVVTRRTAQNAVTIRDGGTVALAGLTENRTRESDKRVPWFSDLPLIGGAFKNNNADKATRELAIFVTARIVPEFGATAGQFSGSRDSSPRGMPSNDDAFRRELENSLNR